MQICQSDEQQLEILLTEIRACRVCEEHLALGPRPILQAETTARVAIISQAPGTKAHSSGVPFDDASGDRLRTWMQVDKATFYDPSHIAIVPMGFCYPGKGKSGDLPPRKECAPLWHKHLLKWLSTIKLTILIGQYAQKYYLGATHRTLTERVQSWYTYAPAYFPLPHPSPRNQFWFTKNPWFESDVLPAFQEQLQKTLNESAFC